MFSSETLAQRLQDAMDVQGLSAGELAAESGLWPMSVYRYLSGEQIPRLDSACKLADVLDLSLDELVGRTQKH